MTAKKTGRAARLNANEAAHKAHAKREEAQTRKANPKTPKNAKE